VGGLASLLVWLAFGAISVPTMLAHFVPLTIVYAVLSLTLVRMLPVALASIGAGLDRATVLFVGWFGPRGLASLVFALLALETLGPASDEAVAVITATVLLSVLAHGFSAAPLAARYGRGAAGPEPGGPVPVTAAPARGLSRRHAAAPGSRSQRPRP
jgi:NhaP-type Na+/H+ or K+/H+ antiporter